MEEEPQAAGVAVGPVTDQAHRSAVGCSCNCCGNTSRSRAKIIASVDCSVRLRTRRNHGTHLPLYMAHKIQIREKGVNIVNNSTLIPSTSSASDPHLWRAGSPLADMADDFVRQKFSRRGEILLHQGSQPLVDKPRCCNIFPLSRKIMDQDLQKSEQGLCVALRTIR